MSAHIVYECIDSEKPATLSKKILTDLLRKELHFEGIIITDSMEMNAIKKIYGSLEGCVMAIEAGADMLCLTRTEDLPKNVILKIEEKVLNGEIDEARINQSVERILKHKNKIYQTYFQTFLNAKFEEVKDYLLNSENKILAQKITDESLTLVKGKDFVHRGKVLLINPKSIVLNIADDESNNADFAQICAREIPDFSTITMENKPTTAEIKKIKTILKNYDIIIYVTYNLILNPEQQVLLDNLLSLNDKLYVISTRLPYDLIYSKKIENYLCVYEYTPNSVRSVIKYLKGEIKALGQPIGSMYE